MVLPEDILDNKEHYYLNELVKTKLELMRKIDSKIFNILRNLKN